LTLRGQQPRVYGLPAGTTLRSGQDDRQLLGRFAATPLSMFYRRRAAPAHARSHAGETASGPGQPGTDLRYDPDGPLPQLQCLFRDGFRVGFADGHIGWLPKGTDEATLRAFITRNGGEKPGRDW
jgi:hypothetical protein